MIKSCVQKQGIKVCHAEYTIYKIAYPNVQALEKDSVVFK